MTKLLWKPTEEQIKRTNMYRFMKLVNERFNTGFNVPLYLLNDALLNPGNPLPYN